MPGAYMVLSQTKCMFILKHYFASTLFTAVCEAFSNAYLDMEVPNTAMIN
jgi:hypothetical protein